MRVAVGVSCGELARYSIFFDSLMHVRGVTNDNVFVSQGAVISRNRNRIATRAIEEGYDAVWYVDDDQVFSPATLEKLIARDKDIVSGLYLKREVPFLPQVYDREDERGAVFPRLLKNGERGMVKAVATGAGCLLVKTKVFEAMEKPWWRLGQLDKEEWSDDVDFCRRARAAGFDIWADLDVLVGHQMNSTIWPAIQGDGSWATFMVHGREVIVAWPPAQELPAEVPPLPNTPSPNLVVPSNFTRPGEKSHFYQEIQGFFDFEDVYRAAVNNSPDGARFVEVGTWLGRSAAFMAVEVINSKKNIELHVVDTWNGDPGIPATTEFMKAHNGRKLFEENMRKGGVLDRFTVHQNDSVKAAADFADRSIDFCFIDGSHGHPAVVADIKAWLPKVKVGGVLAGHDYSDSFVGVKHAVQDCFGDDFQVAGASWLHVVK